MQGKPVDDLLDSDPAKLARLRELAKRELRSRMRSVRGALPRTACAERSARAIARVSELPELQAARTLVGFSAIQRELDLAALLAEARTQGKCVGLPRVVQTDDTDDAAPRLELLALNDEPLVEGAFGVLEPPESALPIDPAAVDVILVPGLAFDAQGQRLGYGRAFYDRLLPTLPNAFRIGIGYDFQFVAELPVDPHDVPLHCIVSDARVLRIAP